MQILYFFYICKKTKEHKKEEKTNFHSHKVFAISQFVCFSIYVKKYIVFPVFVPYRSRGILFSQSFFSNIKYTPSPNANVLLIVHYKSLLFPSNISFHYIFASLRYLWNSMPCTSWYFNRWSTVPLKNLQEAKHKKYLFTLSP